MATFETQLAQGKNPWSTTDFTKPKPPPKFVDRFNTNTTKVFDKFPSAFNASSLGMNNNNAANSMIQQRQAANSMVANPTLAKQTIGDTPESIINPQAQQENEETYTDGLSGIDAMGKNATAGLMQQLEQQKRAGAANANSGGGSGGILNMDGFDEEQVGYANQIIRAGQARGLSGDDIQTALMTALAESGLRNLNYGDRDSVGLFQQRTSQGWGTIDQIMNADYSIGKFYDALGSSARGPNLWNTAQNVQRSAFADGSNYQAQASKAASLWGNYQQNGGVSTAPVTGPNGSASWINANNGKYHDYDGAYGAQCVDLYAFYTSGFAGGTPFGVGYAQELWSNYDNNAYVRVGGNQSPQMGDVAIWSNGFNGMGGHVAIVAQDNGNGTIRTLSANSTSAGSKGNTVMINLSKGSLLGYLRPRKLM